MKENVNEHMAGVDGILLNEMEIDIIAMFRLLPERFKKSVFDGLYTKYRQYVLGDPMGDRYAELMIRQLRREGAMPPADTM